MVAALSNSPLGALNVGDCVVTASRKQQQHTRFRWKGRAIFYNPEDTNQRFVMSVEDEEVYDKVKKRLHYELMSISRKLSQITRRRRLIILQDKRRRRRSVVEGKGGTGVEMEFATLLGKRSRLMRRIHLHRKRLGRTYFQTQRKLCMLYLGGELFIIVEMELYKCIYTPNFLHLYLLVRLLCICMTLIIVL
ncbi:unnamed protein product [Linum trigynum]|uniref:Uncharacterized protein n=1 Tax=Linum trigynum TaxID=586398 RepID=A0AAV2E557_9ROSI